MEKGDVLIVSSEFPPGPGGIGNHAFSLASALHKSGRRVSVISNGDYADGGNIDSFDAAQPFPIRRFRRKGPLTQVLRCIDLVRTLSQTRHTHVIITGLFPIWMLPLVALHPSRPRRHVVIHGHEPIFGSKISKWITALALRFAHALYPVSRFSASNLPKALREKKELHVIPNGIDIGMLETYPRDDVGMKLEGNPVLLTVGHTSPRKGQHRVIKALPEILKRKPGAVYHIVGRDVNNRGLMELAGQLGVTGSVRFHPPVFPHDRLGSLYSFADVFMLLSENQPNGDVEGFGIVALEANFFGVPVIGAKGCGVEDAVADGRSGLLVDGDDAIQVAEAVSRMMDETDLAKEPESWAREHDWSIIGEIFLRQLDRRRTDSTPIGLIG